MQAWRVPSQARKRSSPLTTLPPHLQLARLGLADPAPPSLASRLPLDACEHICAAVRRLPPAIATPTLLSLSLVSRTWSSAAQKALHTAPFLNFDAPDTVPPRTFSRLEALLRTLETRDDLARSVQWLDIGRWTARCSSEAKVDRRRISSLAVRIVAACPALKILSMPFVVQADKKDLVVALRVLSHLGHLVFDEAVAVPDPWIINVDVSIKEEWGQAVWTIADLAALAPSWPRMKKLEMSSAIRGGPGDEVVNWPIQECALLLQQNIKLSYGYLDRLLRGGRGSLCTIHIREHRLEPGALARFVKEYGSSLERIRTYTNDRFTVDEPLIHAIATSCPKLRSLVLSTPIPNVADALDELSRLPRLQTIALGTCFAINLDRIRVANTLRAFRSLKSLSISPGLHDDPNYMWGRFLFDDFCVAIDDIRDAVEEDGIRVRELPSWDGRTGFKPIRTR